MKPNKKKSAVLMVVLIIILGNLFRTRALDNIRAVDVLQILASGVCLGAILVLILYPGKRVNT